MKLGVFGGTFNPVHFGHLINAQFIRENCSLDRILFIPSRYPVHKNLEDGVPAEDRFNMLELAINGNPGFIADSVEIDRKEKSYTIITVKHLLEKYTNSEIFLITGSDAFNEIDTWKDYDELIEIVNFIVMRRDGDINYKNEIVKKVKNVIFADNPLIEISSSKIRENIKKGLSIKYLLPESVEKYIIDRGLYRN